MSETTCPVFYPTEQEFQNFRLFIEQIERLHPDIGICKIVPPKSWYVREYDIGNLSFTIQKPVKQMVTGRAGAFNVDLLEKSNMTVQQF